MVRPKDQEMTATEKIVCYSQIPKRRGPVIPGRATQGSTRVGQEAEGGGKMWARAFIVVFLGRNGRGSISSLGIG